MPATNLSKQPKAWASYPSAGASFSPWADVRYCTAPNTWAYAKKVYAHNGTNWVEVWNNRPVTVNGAGSSSAYNSITLTGTVDPNNFTATPRFYYKKSTDSTYTADTALSSVSGDTVQSVGSKTITGLTENTTYNYYLSATNDAGTSDIPAVSSVTTQYDCRTAAEGAAGWSPSSPSCTTISCGSCDCGTTTRTQCVTTWTKTGCSSYTTTDPGTCSSCTSLTTVYSGTITTTDGATETYKEQCDDDQNYYGFGCATYAALTRCYPSGSGTKCGCGTYEVLAYTITYCSSSNTYTRTLANGYNAPGCISLI